ncbi:MAG: hypothetical protein V4660_09480 [Pseudomonadota bacterium]
MNTLKEYGDMAKSLSKNPLGIISLFIILIYGFAALVVGVSSHLNPVERFPIILFMVLFPVLVLGVFAWLVSQHYEKLYAPQDYNNDEGFLKARYAKLESRPGLKELDKLIEGKVKSVLNSGDILDSYQSKEKLQKSLELAAKKITNQIRIASFITIDARTFTGSDKDIFEFPVSAFSTFSELTNEIYFSIAGHLRPFEYGFSWVIKNPSSGQLIKNARMITGTKAGIPVRDSRSLDEVGIVAGMVLEIVRPSS